MQHERGVRVGRPTGLRIVIHRSWVPAAALGCAHLTVGVFGAYDLVPALSLSIVTLAGVLGSVIVHELAHAGPARGRRTGVIDVTVYPFGGVTRYANEPDDPVPDAVVALSGIAASALLGGACYAASTYVPGPAGRALWALGIWNAAFAALNLIPGLPLDGGRFARAVLWARSGSKPAATRTAARWGQLAGTTLLAAGVLLFLRDPSAQAGWAGLWLAVAGLFVLYTATGIRRATRLEAALEGRTAGAWARPFAGRLRMDDVVPAADGLFAVADGGRLAGIASGTRAGTLAREAMVPWSSGLSCSASDPLPTALHRMAASGAGAVVVLDERGVVRGVLSSDGVRAQIRGGA